MVIQELYKQVREAAESDYEARLIVSEVCGLSQLDWILNKNRPAADEEIHRCREIIARLKNHEPVQYILGSQEFMSLPFLVCPGVLIPRSDTETLVEQVISRCAQAEKSILEIGVGSGCISISLAHYAKARMTGADISDVALKTAAENGKRCGVSVQWVRWDVMTQPPEEWTNAFDMIVSNPPYIPGGSIETLEDKVKAYEPRLALDGGRDGLDFYRRITELAPRLLKDGGEIWYEIGYDQGDALRKLLAADFTEIQIIQDYSGNDRVAGGILKNRSS